MGHRHQIIPLRLDRAAPVFRSEKSLLRRADQALRYAVRRIVRRPQGAHRHVGADLNLTGPVDPERLREYAFGRPWFHQIDLGHGIISPGIDDSATKLAWLDVPDSLSGKSVLDIGSYDGFFAFEAERRGAARVVASDEFCWSLEGMGDGKGFDIAHWALGSKVEKKVISVEHISPETVGTFDLVFFLGVLYHAPDPMRYLRNAYSVCNELMIVETHIDGDDYDRPMMVFYPKDTLNSDSSNFWGPNSACASAMLYEVGFSKVETLGEHGNRLVLHAYV
jgi:tRNA (mo5U34)-methyltransferase